MNAPLSPVGRPYVHDTDLLCHTAGARRLSTHHTGHPCAGAPAAALMPVSPSAQRLAGPPLLPREHQGTRGHQTPPGARPAKES